ncbi:GFA family protein [Rhizobium sp. LjRoot30]|uniref:GFA family protein n=1 Tax=Rhizobium sp. LjRoot30 TaxID=3342320 RepID=UPI003ECDEA8C
MRKGSCRCGALIVSCIEEPVRVSVCHCLECQRRTGSAFGVQARFSESSVFLDGERREFERVGDSGQWARYSFCPACGSTVAYRNEDAPGVIAVPVGAFADPDFPAPGRSIFEGRKHEWVRLERDGIRHFRDGQVRQDEE